MVSVFMCGRGGGRGKGRGRGKEGEGEGGGGRGGRKERLQGILTTIIF